MEDKSKIEDENLNELLAGVDEFAKAMKKRLIERHNMGETNWNKTPLTYSEYKITNVSTEISFNPSKDVDTANWCLIHWLNRRK